MNERTDVPGYTGEHRSGDKVRMRGLVHTGARGVISVVDADVLEVSLNDGQVARVTPDDVTNYSLAARRAWAVMPKRSGRPRGSAKKKMVSFRLDGDVIEMLARARSTGRLENASEAVNLWLRERLRGLLGE